MFPKFGFFITPILVLVFLILFGVILPKVFIEKENIQNQNYKKLIFNHSNCYPDNQYSPGIRITPTKGIRYESVAFIQNP